MKKILMIVGMICLLNFQLYAGLTKVEDYKNVGNIFIEKVKKDLGIDVSKSNILRNNLIDIKKSDQYSINSYKDFADKRVSNGNIKFMNILISYDNRIFNFFIVYDNKTKLLIETSAENVVGTEEGLVASLEDDLKTMKKIVLKDNYALLSKTGYFTKNMFVLDKDDKIGLKLYSNLLMEFIK